ncbi:DnaT-like ssDNA-binding protein [uncultured Sphingomonas sp.]|uniref:DnaT-like ssDNA-binding protein n=1 Tax=uncultured Sphingomonas sp. TaxID=158754 RepID=UPI0025D58A18|nr:DnaT-like ssDNA-binding protein [uncultured Sphingomonas sp.]
MALIVGNLLTDPAAQSFISREDADAYLGVEMNEAWNLAGHDEQEAALVRASRWLVGAYRFLPLDVAGLAQIGRVTARLAGESMNRPLFAGTDTGAVVQSERVGPVAITYATGIKADAAGMAWPWLKPMLAGLIRSGNTVPVLRA